MIRLVAALMVGGGGVPASPATARGWSGSIPPLLNHITLSVGLLLLIVGLVILVAARRHHKVIVVLLSAAVGWYGALAFVHSSPTTAIIYAAVGTLAGLLLLGIMRLIVVLSSATVGALFGTALWTTLQRPPDFWWMAAAAGSILLGLIASLLYDRAVILACTMLGACGAIIGAAVVLLHAGYGSQGREICGTRAQWPLRLSVAILIVTLVSVLLQWLDRPSGHDAKET